MTRRAAALGVALVLCVSGCGHKVEPVAPEPPRPPAIDEVHPAARSVGISYDETEVWARFSHALDSSTVNARNVFLKVDSRRLPVTVVWDGATRRIVLRPADPFQLGETYTVELSPDVAGADGTLLGTRYWWQFTVAGIRRLEHPFPGSASVGESPFTPLGWDRTEASAGTVIYDVYAGDDSATVAARQLAPAGRVTRAEFVRLGAHWASGQTYYWAVTAHNQTTGERLEGPVWSFRTVPADALQDSVVVIANRWGFYARNTRTSSCLGSTVNSGPNFACVVGFDLAQIRPRRRIAGARIYTSTSVQNPPNSYIASTQARVTIDPCNFGAVGIPVADQVLSTRRQVGPFLIEYRSDALTAHLAAAHYGFTVSGYYLGSDATVSYGAPPTLTLYFYR